MLKGQLTGLRPCRTCVALAPRQSRTRLVPPPSTAHVQLPGLSLPMRQRASHVASSAAAAASPGDDEAAKS
ncbi:hypothetical protein TSOC_001414, partial [Tetrabaena socialis]